MRAHRHAHTHQLTTTPSPTPPKTNDVRTLVANPAVLGQVKKVAYLLRVLPDDHNDPVADLPPVEIKH